MFEKTEGVTFRKRRSYSCSQEYLPDSVSFVGTVPVLVFLMTGETVQYVCPILADIINYSPLLCYFLNMAGNAMFHIFAGRAGTGFLKIHEEHGFHIPGHICQLFPGGI